MNNTANVNTTNFDTNTNNLPPPVMLRITLTFRDQMKTLNDLMPKIRIKKTGEYMKLYTNTFEEYHELNNLLEKLNYEFYSITPKAQRPIKVIIKGLPKDTKTADIHSDLIVWDSPSIGSLNL
ncbi:hypothetical protein TNCV_1154971 [Trichonephila clavipes]|nr:hypothetical protein TNCV_1154971 [Trichonephila clavipes]